MVGRGLQDLTLGGMQVAEELDSEPVSDQAMRLAVEETVRSCLHGELKDTYGYVRAEHITRRCAVWRRHLHRLFDGHEDEALAAKFEERSMSAFRVGRPSQQRDRGLLADERHEPLACPVPIDEEHEPRTQVGEVGREHLPVGRLEPARRHVMRSQAGARRLEAPLRPVDIEPIEHVLEESQPSEMDVGVRHGCDQPFDRHDEHVGLGHPDVVLDEQSPANMRRRRPETGMIELQRGGSMKPGHERGDELAVIIFDRRRPPRRRGSPWRSRLGAD